MSPSQVACSYKHMQSATCLLMSNRWLWIHNMLQGDRSAKDEMDLIKCPYMQGHISQPGTC